MNTDLSILAGDITIEPTTGFASGFTGWDITTYIPVLINVLFVAAAVIFFFMLIIGGIRWIASGGDQSQTAAARAQITSAIIGLLIVLSTFAIVNLIEVIFDVKITEGLDFGTP